MQILIGSKTPRRLAGFEFHATPTRVEVRSFKGSRPRPQSGCAHVLSRAEYQRILDMRRREGAEKTAWIILDPERLAPEAAASAAIQEEIDERRAQLAAMQDELGKRKERVAGLNTEISDLIRLREELQVQCAEAQEVRDMAMLEAAGELERVRAELGAKDKALAEAAGELERVRAELGAKDKALAEAAGELERVRAELGAKDKKRQK